MRLSPILLVTTNHADSKLLSQSLANRGVVVHCVDSSSDADVLRFLDAVSLDNTQRLSLIVVDLDDVHGYRMGLLSKISQHSYGRKLPTLVFSQNNDHFFVSHIYQLEATSVFRRPTDWDQFAQSLVSYWGDTTVRLPDEREETQPIRVHSGQQGNTNSYYLRSHSE